MARNKGIPIQVRPYPNTSYGGSQLLLDGKELPQLRSFVVRVPAPDEISTLEAEILAYGELNLELTAEVKLTVVAIPGYVLEVETDGNVTRYRVREARVSGS